MEYKQKRAVIEQLMDHWQDFFLPSEGGFAGGEGEGLGIAFVSSMGNHSSVAELGRCLDVLQQHIPAHYRQLSAWYRSEWRTVDLPVKRRDVRGRMVDDVARSRVRVTPYVLRGAPSCRERVCGCDEKRKPRVVCRSLDILLGLWDRGVTLEVPLALRRKLREYVSETGEHGWTEEAA